MKYKCKNCSKLLVSAFLNEKGNIPEQSDDAYSMKKVEYCDSCSVLLLLQVDTRNSDKLLPYIIKKIFSC